MAKKPDEKYHNNRQTPIKHNKTNTFGDISTLKGMYARHFPRWRQISNIQTHVLLTSHLASLSETREHPSL